MTDIHVEPLSGAMGAEIHGLALSQPLDPTNRSIVMDAFRDHLAIFVTDQRIDPGQMTAFVSEFGAPLGAKSRGRRLLNDFLVTPL